MSLILFSALLPQQELYACAINFSFPYKKYILTQNDKTYPIFLSLLMKYGTLNQPNLMQ